MDGERLKNEVVTMDKECREKLKMMEHVPVPTRSALVARELGRARVHGEVIRLHVAAQGGETSAHGKLPKAGRTGVEGPRRRTQRRDA